MTTPPNRRRNLRLPAFDYSTPGSYFVTICVQNRACVLGDIVDGTLHLSPVGTMVETHLRMAADRFPGVALDLHVSMPNHLHVIFDLSWSIDDALAPSTTMTGPQEGISLGQVIHWFKSATTNEYIRRVRVDGWPRFPGKLWQPNYHEHIVRDQIDLARIREYIVANPGKWAEDKEYQAICRGF